jgi:hypothetical protein
MYFQGFTIVVLISSSLRDRGDGLKDFSFQIVDRFAFFLPFIKHIEYYVDIIFLSSIDSLINLVHAVFF